MAVLTGVEPVSLEWQSSIINRYTIAPENSPFDYSYIFNMVSDSY